mmetsp:Transcript_31812/g.58804  ORF Transcript_31812/g.58804 Transcript_31812/m.58804 type:complete len:377 (+) Transcript_31812:20-1150(+)
MLNKLFEALDVDGIGGQINRILFITKRTTKDHPANGHGQDVSRWGKVVFVLLAFLIALYGVCVFGVAYLLPMFPTPNTDKHFYEFDTKESIVDAIKNTIPPVKKWYRSIDDYPLLPIRVDSNMNSFDTSCVEYFSEQFKEFVPKTSPEFVRIVLKNLGSEMATHPLILKALHDLLTEPQDLTDMFQETERCMSASASLSAITCVAKDHLQMDLNALDQRTIYRYTINFGAVLEALTIRMETDLPLLAAMAEIGTTSRLKEYTEFVSKTYQNNDDKTKFLSDKYNSVMFALKFGVGAKVSNHYEGCETCDLSLALIILEAVKLDVDIGHTANARVGVAIAPPSTMITPFVRDNIFRWELGREWVDAYLAWVGNTCVV